jgi:D-apionolactonase
MQLLHAGALTVKYDNGSLRHLSHGHMEIVRMIYFALRDHNWGTMPFTISDEKIEASVDSFRISYRCTHNRENENLVAWDCKISGDSDGTIEFTINGKVLTDFRKNRAGFCLLHPLQNMMGRAVEIQHPVGATKTTFPVHIDPENPFKNIVGMKWSLTGQQFALRFTGDIFETEDQRNWADASFKTFCTPLDKPFPTLIRKGDTISQSIRFSVGGQLNRVPTISDVIELSDTNTEWTVPPLGVAASTEVEELSPQHLSLLKDLHLNHYRIDITPSQNDWVTKFSRECVIASSIGASAEIVLHLSADFEAEITAFTQLCLQNRLRINSVLLLSKDRMVTDEKIFSAMSSLKQGIKEIKVGAGTNYNFTEINRNRFGTTPFDFIGFGIHPQEHAFDDLTIIENMEAQLHTVKSTRGIYGQTIGVHVSPVTIRRRYNPYATNASELLKSNAERADPRQSTAFVAAWTFGSFCSLGLGGCSSVTYFQTVGKQGIIPADGEVYPVYHTLKLLAQMQGSKVRQLSSDRPLEVQGIINIETSDGIFGNFAGTTKRFSYAGKTQTLAPHEIRIIRSDSAK